MENHPEIVHTSNRLVNPKLENLEILQPPDDRPVQIEGCSRIRLGMVFGPVSQSSRQFPKPSLVPTPWQTLADVLPGGTGGADEITAGQV